MSPVRFNERWYGTTMSQEIHLLPEDSEAQSAEGQPEQIHAIVAMPALVINNAPISPTCKTLFTTLTNLGVIQFEDRSEQNHVD
ncbi:MAG: hypothetical protein AAFV33_14985 [Chloroflexota bacterium]